MEHVERHEQPEIEPQPATVHEIRPVDDLKVCASCLVSNAAADAFCTACGAPLDAPAADAGSEAATEVRNQWPGGQEQTAIQPQQAGLAAPVHSASLTARQRRWPTIGAIVAAVVVAGAFAVLWQMQTAHAHKLSRTLSATRTSLASAAATLHTTRAKLQSATALSEKRRDVLLRAKDVLAKVDPLLSSVDTIQNKAATVGSRGTTLSSDSETFISTVADLVNYMIHNDAAYYDWGYINQQIDSANTELGTIHYDEGALSGDTSAYGGASDKFGTKASAFTQSVRALQKQLNKASGG